MAFKKLKLWFDEDLAKMLAKKIRENHPDFPHRPFIKAVKNGVDDLELKARVALIADQLHQNLGTHYPENLAILMQILGPENEEETGMFSNFYWVMPIAQYVETYGLDHFRDSMKALCEITKRNTSEYAIRPYIEKYPERTLKNMLKWAQHKNVHIRRLASEGGRPRLPWAGKLQQFIDDPSPLLPILDILKDDSTKYVQKSVANCLNDILKDNETIARQLLEKWTQNPSPQRRWIIKHALRNKLKQEEAWASKLIAQSKKK